MNFDYITNCKGHNLYSIEVVKRMVNMYSEYKKSWAEETINPIEEYYAKRYTDPVQNFVDYILLNTGSSKKVKEIEDDEEQKAVTEYIISKFYALKGTKEVIERLESYLGLEVEYYTYTNLELEIAFKESSISPWVSDEINFNAYFTEFIKALIFILNKEQFDIGEAGTELVIKDTVEISYLPGLKVFKFVRVENNDTNNNQPGE